MKTFFAAACLWFWLSVAGAQNVPVEPRVAYSDSGQFVVLANPAPIEALRPASVRGDTNLLALDPPLLAVACERVKQALWNDLGLTGPWSGKIFLVLHPARSPDESITVASERFPDRWTYHLALPDRVNRLRFLRALTEVLLLEIANRGRGSHPAEIPIWLREGFVEQWLTFEGPPLIPPAPTRSVNGLKLSTSVLLMRGYDPLKEAHAVLRTNPPVTFEELSWPEHGDFKGERGERYRCAAQLFIARLLSLPEGRAGLRAMFSALPHYYNWQIAFLRAFPARFHRLIDVEKWWALNLIQFVGRDPAQAWSLDESLRKLNEAIHPAVQVRTSTNELPRHADATLQTAVRDWTPDEQDDALQRVVVGLQLLRLHLAPSVAALADEYRATLETYLKRTEPDLATWRRRHRVARSHVLLVRDTLRQLAALDARRAELRNPAPAVAAAQTRPPGSR